VTHDVGRLCENLARDPSLRLLLDTDEAVRLWTQLAGALLEGVAPALVRDLLASLDATAAAAGVDGLASTDRQYQPLPSGVGGFPTAAAWRCPHPRRCGRVQAVERDAQPPVCALTGDPLAWITVHTG
jgi:hypothetical protein